MRSKELSLSLEQPLESVQFDRAIQAFLERRGQEAMPLEAMQAINTGDFAFIQISHICYERERDCLDFQQTLSAAANIGGGGQFAYLVDSDGQNLKLYLGVCQQSSTHSTQAHDIDNAAFLRDSFAGIYAGSHCEICAQNPLQAPPCLCTSHAWNPLAQEGFG